MASFIARLTALVFIGASAVAAADSIETLDVNVVVPGAQYAPGHYYSNGFIGGTLTYDLTTGGFLYGSIISTGYAPITNIISSPLGSIGSASGIFEINPSDISTFSLDWDTPLGATPVTQVTSASYGGVFNNGESGSCSSNCGPPATLTIERAASAPEIDPASGIGALMLLACGLAIIRGKRFKAPIPDGSLRQQSAQF